MGFKIASASQAVKTQDVAAANQDTASLVVMEGRGGIMDMEYTSTVWGGRHLEWEMAPPAPSVLSMHARNTHKIYNFFW